MQGSDSKEFLKYKQLKTEVTKKASNLIISILSYKDLSMNYIKFSHILDSHNCFILNYFIQNLTK